MTSLTRYATLTTVAVLLACASEARPKPKLAFSDPVVQQGVLLAYEAIQRPECFATLEHFKVSISLEDAMTKLGALTFAEGNCNDRSQSTRIAYTTVSGYTVWICRQRFDRARREMVGAVMVHELFHTLGLDETPDGVKRGPIDPPTSIEITREVLARCFAK